MTYLSFKYLNLKFETW